MYPYRLRVKATALKDPTTADALASLIPASKAEEALVKKAGSKVSPVFTMLLLHCSEATQM